jgi:hypothetical protein
MHEAKKKAGAQGASLRGEATEPKERKYQYGVDL